MSAHSPDFAIATILPGRRDDQGWSEQVYGSLARLTGKLGARLMVREQVAPESADAVLLAMVRAEKPDLVVAYGGEYAAAVRRLARLFPDIDFVTTDASSGNSSNLGSIYFDPYHTAYLAGRIAALATRTGRVAFVLGDKIPNTMRDAEAFVEGVREANPAILARIGWVGSWFDAQRAIGTVALEVEAGVDVIAVNTYQSDAAVIRYLAERQVATIGFHNDQAPHAPDWVLTSILVDFSKLLEKAVHLAYMGRWSGRHHVVGIPEGAVRLAPFGPRLTAEARATIARIANELAHGGGASSKHASAEGRDRDERP